jgi:hypothetical protein
MPQWLALTLRVVIVPALAYYAIVHLFPMEGEGRTAVGAQPGWPSWAIRKCG